jgi:nucleotide-binding universal stress UspA family protein
MKIIIPTDFSENAYKAVAYVYDNFKHQGLKISLIHSIKQPATSSGVMLRLDDMMMKDAERDMAKLMSQIWEAYEDKPEVIIRNGYLKDWVEQVAKVKAPDLIVMGTKGENNIASKLMGSVTESIIRTSQYPVLAVPASSDSKPLHRLTICTAKGELPQARFIRNLVSHVAIPNARIEVLRILTSEDQKAQRSISLDKQQIRVETLRNTDVVDGINEYLATSEVDMLCLYHSHTTRLDYLFNRSITKRICANVELPLLVMRGA